MTKVGAILLPTKSLYSLVNSFLATVLGRPSDISTVARLIPRKMKVDEYSVLLARKFGFHRWISILEHSTENAIGHSDWNICENYPRMHESTKELSVKLV